MKYLRLVGLVPKQCEPLHQREKELGILVEAFNEMTKHGKNVYLNSLTLRVVVIGEDGAKSLPVNSIYRG